jgi:AcrR family transcriptional regulator
VTSSRTSPERRRAPVQARSRERGAAIVDAAAHVFAEVGFDAATTDAIAARAATSVGSIYQFYPNKLALFQAVAERCVDRARQLHAATLGADPDVRPWRELLDGVVDAFSMLQRTDVGFRAISMNLHLYGVFEESDNALHRELIAASERGLLARAPHLPVDQRRVVATMMVQIISAMLHFAARESPRAGQRLMDETKIVLHRYLAPYLEPTSGRRAARGARSKSTPTNTRRSTTARRRS